LQFYLLLFFLSFPDYRSLSFSAHIFFFFFMDFQQPEDLENGFTSDVESKCKKIYEDDINPFAAFSKKVVIF